MNKEKLTTILDNKRKYSEDVFIWILEETLNNVLVWVVYSIGLNSSDSSYYTYCEQEDICIDICPITRAIAFKRNGNNIKRFYYNDKEFIILLQIIEDSISKNFNNQHFQLDQSLKNISSEARGLGVAT
jgi:hypothetical protein